jgi:hypothetical protein
MKEKKALKLALKTLKAETDPNWDCTSYHPKIWEAITAIKQALAQPAVPEGWKLIPVVPTKEMAIAYWQFNDRQDVRMIDAWNAMLEAAPEKGNTP